MTPVPEDLNEPSMPAARNLSPGPYSSQNVRVSSGPKSWVYPSLLIASTCVAAAFCLLYITKPVIITAPSILTAHPAAAPIPPVVEEAPATDPPPAPESLLPAGGQLPGDPVPPVPAATPNARPVPPVKSTHPPTEETNLRIQHILTAEAPGGHLDRIDLDVPVLYHSRNLRWTPADVTRARELMIQLMDYQEKTQILRVQGAELLDQWNALIGKSIPASELRADSPTLPANQQDAADAPLPVGLISEEAIQLEPVEK